MTPPLRIVVLSDITIGYAAPQIEALASALRGHYAPAEAFIFEPDQKGRRALAAVDDVAVVRLVTRMPPHSEAFHVEYNVQLRHELDRLDPDIVVFPNASVVPALLLARKKPALVVYYMLESLAHQRQSGGSNYLDLNQMVRDQVDIVVVPERRRGEIDLDQLGWRGKPMIELLNVSVACFSQHPIPHECRFLHAGTLGPQTYWGELMDPQLAELSIDFAGPIDTEDTRALVADLSRFRGRKRYLGLLPKPQLHDILPRYAYRLVLWRPDDYHTLYASPNKMFESIAAGIPPICTPHPQCVDILREFDCGIVLEDWSREALFGALRDACAIFGTTRYDEMVGNCRTAVADGLNWGDQFAALRQVLPQRDTLQARITRSSAAAKARRA